MHARALRWIVVLGHACKAEAPPSERENSVDDSLAEVAEGDEDDVTDA